MNAYVGTIRAQDECPEGCSTGYVGPFCPDHQPIKGYRWAVHTLAGVESGEARTSDAAWVAVKAAA